MFLLFALLPEAILEGVLIPQYPYIVKFLLPNELEENIGHYVGILGSAFYLPLFVMNLFWGAASDKIGPKPILIAGLIVCLITTIGFGLAQNFWILVFLRFLSGIFGANSTVAKGMIGETFRNQDARAWSYSLYGSVYGVSGIIGPLIGGILSNPASLYPDYIGKDSLLGRFPYLLTSMVGSLLALCSLYTTIFYLRTKGNKEPLYDAIDDMDSPGALQLTPISRQPDSSDAHDGNQSDDSQLGVVRRSPTRKRNPFTLDDDVTLVEPAKVAYSFTSWKTVGPIMLYCILAYTNMAYFTSLPLFLSASAPLGLNLNSRDTSFFVTTISMAKLLVQLVFVEKLIVYLRGPIPTYRLGMFLYMPAHLLVPMLSGTPIDLVLPPLLFFMTIFGGCESLGYVSIMLIVTDSAGPSNLGMAHGFASTMAAFVRTIAPSITGYLWEVGVHHGWPGFMFAFGAVTSALGGICAQFV